MRRICTSQHSVLLVRYTETGTEELIAALGAGGFDVGRAQSMPDAVAAVMGDSYPVILFDLNELSSASGRSAPIPSVPAGGDERDVSGFAVFGEIRRLSPASQLVVLMTGGAKLATCCEAVTRGASGFVEWSPGKPIQRVADSIRDAMARYEAALRQGHDIHSRAIFDEAGIAGKSQIMAKVLFQAKRAAIVSDATVLISGESGTGKQVLAEAIHRMDPKRRDKPFLTVNCAAITGTLAESSLFGHRKGAFTGATEDRAGYFRAADGGTLLLDEISELEKPLQPKLLRVLQEGLVLPVGDDREHKVDVRVVAASNRPLPVLVEKGEFRLDLYQRLNVISLSVPPLRERPEDIPPLVHFFLKQYASYYPAGIESVDERVFEVLAHCIGSGNVRELENAVRQMLVFKVAGRRLGLADIPPDLIARRFASREESQVTGALASAVDALLRNGNMTLPEMVEQFEAMIINEALSRSSASQSELAQRLGLSRRTFYNKLRKHDLPRQAQPGT